ncbi:MAG: hypothetical protein ACREID_05625 [Planctomycetota bacterium]
MKYGWVFVTALVVGCGGGIGSFEDAIEAQIDATEDLNQALGGIKDKRSAEAARPRIEAFGKRMEEIQDRMSKLEPPKDPPDEARMAELQQELTEVGKKVAANMERISADPEALEALNAIMARLGPAWSRGG